ncbi:hypothetical protein EJB05_49743, partial [Eragrostis curvula]
MDKTSHAAGLTRRRLRAAAIAVAVAAILISFPLSALAIIHQRSPPATRREEQPTRTKETEDALKGCFITDPNGRKWACSRMNNPAAKLTLFECAVENRLGAGMNLYCADEAIDQFVGAGATVDLLFPSVFDPAPRIRPYTGDRTGPNVTCEWFCAGNTMTGVVVWDERWPEAWSCRKDGGDGQCRLVFESSREVVLVTRAGRRVLGDLAIKDCSKNLWGYGGWVPFGLGCTYPKHDHDAIRQSFPSQPHWLNIETYQLLIMRTT